MTDIKVKILSNRKVEIPYRRFGGTQGDTGYRVKFDISDIYENDRIYRVEWYGAADSFTETIPLEVKDGFVYAYVPNEICKCGGTAKAYLVEEKLSGNEVYERICTYPIRLYFNNKPTRDNSISVGEYERNVTDMYLSVVNAKEQADKKYNEAKENYGKSVENYDEAVEKINGKADKEYVDSLTLKKKVVSELPTENIQENTIYLVPKENATDDDRYNEFIFIPNESNNGNNGSSSGSGSESGGSSDNENGSESGGSESESGGTHTHIWSGWIIDREPTETEEGSKHIQCIVCGEIIQTATIPKKETDDTHEHILSDWIIDKEPTDTEKGSAHKVCTICGEVLDATELLAFTDVEAAVTYSVSNGEAEITDCSTALVGNVIIPSELGGYPVTSIGGQAFAKCIRLTNVIIPDSVTSIGNGAFEYCTSLTSLNIPDSVTEINSIIEPFGGCTSLTNINVDENNQNYCSVDGVLFNKDKTELIYYPEGNTRTSYTIPDSVTSITGTFKGRTHLTSLTIGNGITEINGWKFAQCSNLTNVTIGSNVKSIGEYAFYWCESLSSITIPDNVTSIDNWAFYRCDSLTSVVIGNGVTSIGDAAFSYCPSLTSVTIGNSVVSLGIAVFRNCTSLESIIIPNSITSISDYTFADCTSLTSITIPDSVTSIGVGAFERCNVKEIIIADGSKTVPIDLPLAERVTIPGSVTSIEDDTFFGFNSLTIYGYSGSIAETYANNHNITFVALD